ncbi:translation factor GTPase family protein [Scatolibacter rhodanostii]|uniref:translation factor GTPase family protein n=1 Tax=Scatolibacter rhodanostii TaxID=2014781 RepID=UPI000C07CEF7|nr:TetM/TetW/TetO/TetS family tetracycline resistance ribosomal protection protein [Scatolibacter rhodanostii]
MEHKLTIGILAHVDAGKTTLSEALLYTSGKIGKPGRVDNQNAYLDTEQLEKQRGITIFSKQAVFEWKDKQVTLLDTPGHIDFSAEMERTLSVLDYAVLVISAADGVQEHTRTVWRLLKSHGVPVFLFVNKMDQAGVSKELVFKEMIQKLSENIVDFTVENNDNFFEQLALCDEELLKLYLTSGNITEKSIAKSIQKRKVFPCFFGSALKLTGIQEFMEALSRYTHVTAYPNDFGAKVFKITRDEQGNRLTHMKITGGILKVKDSLTFDSLSEKVNQIRIYSGQRYETVGEVSAGTICAVTGLTESQAGIGIGKEKSVLFPAPVLEPVLSYRIFLPENCDPAVIMPKLRQLEEEEPALHLIWDEQLHEIQAQLMGEVQTEILKSLILERFGVVVSFGEGNIVYKETIQNKVEGVGHFEPLRHYAEVHLIIEPAVQGSGLLFESQCSEDLLAKNWQRLVMTHLKEKSHKGVLAGFPITDMKIILASGRAHNKHTEGGDFREATYRAVRQGLKSAKSVLLEPYYAFELDIPENNLGRAISDIEKLHGTFEISHTRDNRVVITGKAPVSTMRNYNQEVIAYTRGQGRLFCNLSGYEPCHNEQEVVGEIGYDSERDLENPTGSIFCAHGAGYFVEWNHVQEHMHLASSLAIEKAAESQIETDISNDSEKWISPEEIQAILQKSVYANKGKKSVWKNNSSQVQEYPRFQGAKTPKIKKKKYLLVDGYNIIHAWPELYELLESGNMEGARMKLLDILGNYQSISQQTIILVFDAYRVQNHQEESFKHAGVVVVYTKEAQTADQYIEKFAYDHQKDYHITVATSDGLQQIITRGAGCELLSARGLKAEIDSATIQMREDYEKIKTIERNFLGDFISEQEKESIKQWLEE